MINVSDEFKTLMEQRTDFKQYAEVTLADGTVLNLDSSRFTAVNNSIVDGAGLTTIPLGVAVQKYIQIEILNDDEIYTDLDFYGARIHLYLTFALSATTEKVERGYYTVTSPATYGDTVIITAVDDMYKADQTYKTSLSFPATIRDMLVDSCDNCGIPLKSTTFKNDTFTVSTAPEGTYRQVIGYIAQIACGNARIDNSGYLNIISYDWSGFDSGEYHTISNFSYPKIETSSVNVTGVQTVITGETVEEDETVMVGAEGYVISIENPLILGQEQTVLTWIFDTMSTITARPFYGDIVANPLVEFMDLAVIVDRRGRSYQTVITDVSFVFLGYTTIKNSFDNPLSMQASYGSETTKVMQYARKLVSAERTSRETAVEQLAAALAAGSGMYRTEEAQDDGSIIYYLHDKPTLSESQNVLKITSDAIGFSSDGGKTYPGGITFNAETVMKIIETEGLKAEWVKVGSTSITDVLTDVQDQVDGAIETHYYNYAPTLSNIPASDWTTEELRVAHEGDLFFDRSTGYTYRFQRLAVRFLTADGYTLTTADGMAFYTTVWGWQRIKDIDISTLETSFKVLDGVINGTVSETGETEEGLVEKVAAVTLTTTGLKTQVSNLGDSVGKLNKTVSDVEQLADSITLKVTGADGQSTSIVINDGTIELSGEVLAQRIAVATLVAKGLLASTATIGVTDGIHAEFTADGRFVLCGYNGNGNTIEKLSFEVYPYEENNATPAIMRTTAGLQLLQEDTQLAVFDYNNVVINRVLRAAGGLCVLDSSNTGALQVFNMLGGVTKIGASESVITGTLTVSGNVDVVIGDTTYLPYNTYYNGTRLEDRLAALENAVAALS